MYVSILNTDGSITIGQGIDEHGNVVKKGKRDYPYSYDGFVLWRGLPQAELNHTLYSDRLKSQNYKNWDELSKKHFGNTGDYFDNRNPAAIQAFLRDLLNKPNYQLGLIMEYCNVSNGYPVWRFDVKVHENTTNAAT